MPLQQLCSVVSLLTWLTQALCNSQRYLCAWQLLCGTSHKESMSIIRSLNTHIWRSAPRPSRGVTALSSTLTVGTKRRKKRKPTMGEMNKFQLE